MKALKAKLRHRWVKTRESQGSTVPYVEGWHAIAEANRIFGFDSWDRQTMSPQLVWSGMQRGDVVCFYSTKVRITVRAGGTITVREGIGSGLGRSTAPELAHETALKAAETDATKRALATFGNPFGLALYDRELSQVTKPRDGGARVPQRTDARSLVLSLSDRRELRFATDQEFVRATLREIERLGSVEDLFAFWSSNMAS